MMTKKTKVEPLPYHEAVQRFSPGNPESDFSKIRMQCFERFKELGFPVRSHESWKYIYLDSILNTPFSRADHSGIELKPTIPPGVKSSSLEEGFLKLDLPFQDWIRASFTKDLNPFSLLSSVHFQEGRLLQIPESSNLNDPVSINFKVNGECAAPFVFHPRLVVILEKGAHARLVLDHRAFTSQSYFMNAAIDIYVAKGASLHITSLQRELQEIHSFVRLQVTQAEESRFEMITFTEGGLTTRQETLVNFQGPGASCDLKNFSLMSGNSRLYQYATAHHEAPQCQSNQLFKTILAGEAQAEVNSMVHVVRDAQKSESKQLIRNLMMSDRARIYSRPQLKIFADDVKCSHGAATGQLDEAELFYLRSRGIAKDQARYLMTLAFAEEVIALLDPLSIRKEIETNVQKKLEKVC